MVKSIVDMNNKDNQSLAELEPELLLQGKTPRLIDEWQIAPELWDAVRFEVDQRQAFGQFILTGSSVPCDKSKILHSGIGRFSWLKMRTISLFESGESNGKVNLSALFSDQNPKMNAECNLSLQGLAFLV